MMCYQSLETGGMNYVMVVHGLLLVSGLAENRREKVFSVENKELGFVGFDSHPIPNLGIIRRNKRGLSFFTLKVVDCEAKWCVFLALKLKEAVELNLFRCDFIKASGRESSRLCRRKRWAAKAV